VRQMDCEQVRELLDGYALGASDGAETRIIEEHVADCVRCWEELSSSQAAAALLALSVRIEHPSEQLERRIMARAQRESAPFAERRPLWQRFRWSPWPATAGAFGAVSLAALAVSGVLMFQIKDVQSKNDDLETQIQAAAYNFQKTSELTSNQLAESETIFSILSGDDHQEVEMKSPGDSNSQVYYTWSASKKVGVVICEGMPALDPGKVYVIWFQAGSEDYAMRPFISNDGSCQVTMDLSTLQERPDGIGITVEDAPGVTTAPNKPWLMWGEVPHS